MAYQAPKGMSDVLPPESRRWRETLRTAEDIFRRYGYDEIILPVLEQTEVFQKGIGATSDIVQKEMFTFADRGDVSLTLRPEGTAGVARAFVQSMTKYPMPLKLYYQGPMFRRERPQKGRYRQFWQLGVELIGSPEPMADAEVIALAWDLVLALGARGLQVLVNSVGDAACRPAYSAMLREYLDSREESLCADCRRRKANNPLRVFDCKEKGCAEVVRGAPLITDHLCDACRKHLDDTLELLAEADIPHALDKSLVRGLDYYTRTVFEFRSPELGAQNTIAAGGRYDDLIESYGGPPTPATGFSLGVERLLMLATRPEEQPGGGVYFVAEEPDARSHAFTLALQCRRSGFRCDIDSFDRSMKAQMKAANRGDYPWVVLIGRDELEGHFLTLKEMETGNQARIGWNELIGYLERK